MNARNAIGVVGVAIVSAAIGARFFGRSIVATPALAPQRAPPKMAASPTETSATPSPMGIPKVPSAGTVQIPAAETEVTAVTDAQYDFRELGDPGQPVKRRFSREQADLQWAPKAENTIRAIVDAQSNIGYFNSVDIECRETLCRIETSIPLTTLEQRGPAGFDWDPMVSRMMSEETWKASFDGNTTIASMDKDLGVATYVTFLHRKPQSGTQARGLIAAGSA